MEKSRGPQPTSTVFDMASASPVSQAPSPSPFIPHTPLETIHEQESPYDVFPAHRVSLPFQLPQSQSAGYQYGQSLQQNQYNYHPVRPSLKKMAPLSMTISPNKFVHHSPLRNRGGLLGIRIAFLERPAIRDLHPQVVFVAFGIVIFVLILLAAHF
jgi:hypothetical protein